MLLPILGIAVSVYELNKPDTMGITRLLFNSSLVANSMMFGMKLGKLKFDREQFLAQKHEKHK